MTRPTANPQSAGPPLAQQPTPPELRALLARHERPHVTMGRCGATMLGEVVGVADAMTDPWLIVQFFNGQRWPNLPALSEVTFLDRSEPSERP